MAMKKYQIFISSTYTDLKEVRDSVTKTILSLPHLPIGMESFSADDECQWDIIREAIDSSDYYVLILGFCYGSLCAEGISYTEKEYDYAIERGIPVLAFLRKDHGLASPEEIEKDPEKIRMLEAFKEKVKGNRLCSFWSTTDSLNKEVAIALNKAFEKYPKVGWIRAENTSAQDLSKLETLENLVVEQQMIIDRFPNLSDYWKTELVGKGLGFPPENDIKKDLTRRHALIPFKAELGGRMRFFSEKNIHILNHKWVIAYFEDGHISGHMILKYDVNDGIINWTVLDAELD